MAQADDVTTGSLDDLELVPTGRAFRHLHAALRRHPTFRPRIAALCRDRIDQLLGVLPADEAAGGSDPATLEALQRWTSDERFVALDRTCLGYAEQFVLDANGIDERLRAETAAVLGDAGLVVFTMWLGVVEVEERLRSLLDLTPGARAGELAAALPAGPPSASQQLEGTVAWADEPGDVPPSVQELAERYAPEVAAARAAVGAAAAGALPARINELVRLVAAQSVDCRYCRNVRYRGDDGQQLVPEDQIAILTDGDLQGMTPREEAAVRFAREFFAGRGPLTAETREQVAAHFDADERLELALVAMRNPAGSKAMIALGLVPDRTPVTVL